MAGFDGTPTKQNFALPFRDTTDNELGVLVMNFSTAGADMARVRISRRDSEFNGCSALGAIVHADDFIRDTYIFIQMSEKPGFPGNMSIGLYFTRRAIPLQ